ncbi:MAG: tetratricopeptide repeat protein [Chitinophagales bacterium]|nr:tetratricopeptide repeat protein [Chitinophagales bacterium]
MEEPNKNSLEHELSISQEAPKSGFNFTIVVLLAVVVVSIGIAAFLFIKKSKPESKSTAEATVQQLSPQEQLAVAIQAVEKQPNIHNFINLGLAYFNNGKFVESIAVNMQIIQADTNNTVALNNICAAYNNLGHYEEAIYFGKKALEKDTANTLAKNNIAFSEAKIKHIAALQQKVQGNAAKGEFIELGLYYYQRKEFKQAIATFEKGLAQHSKDVLLLNNLCASYCEIKQWEKALPYCEEALKLQPDYNLAKNNLQWAKDGKAGKYN